MSIFCFFGVHDWEPWEELAEVEGKVRHCENCQKRQTRIPPHVNPCVVGHSWGVWSDAGWSFQTRQCLICGLTEEIPI